MTEIILSNGYSIPLMGVGTWTLEGEQAANNVKAALEAGFRLIDTAQWYANEAEVGKGIVLSGVTREEIFVTTKVIPSTMRLGAEAVRKSVEESLEKLGTGFIDLFLIHWPVMDYLEETWKVLEDFVDAGKIRSLGVSNFNRHHMEDLLKFARIKPVLNQMEITPYLTQEENVEYNRSIGIQVQAWGTFGQDSIRIADDDTLKAIAEEYGKTASQILLRWVVQRGLITIPRAKPKHFQENLEVFDFVLKEEDMERISKLNRNLRSSDSNDPETFTF